MADKTTKKSPATELLVKTAKKGTKKGKSSKAGRDKGKGQRYRMNGIRERHKIRNIFRSNGPTAAHQYAVDHGLLAFYQTRFKNLLAHRSIGKERVQTWIP